MSFLLCPSIFLSPIMFISFLFLFIPLCISHSSFSFHPCLSPSHSVLSFPLFLFSTPIMGQGTLPFSNQSTQKSWCLHTDPVRQSSRGEEHDLREVPGDGSGACHAGQGTHPSLSAHQKPNPCEESAPGGRGRWRARGRRCDHGSHQQFGGRSQELDTIIIIIMRAVPRLC